MYIDSLLVLNDLGRLLEEVQDNSAYVKNDAKLLRNHVIKTSFGKSTQEIREHFEKDYLKILNGEKPLDALTHQECIDSLQDLVYKIYLTLSRRQLKLTFSATLDSREYIRRRLNAEMQA